MRHTLLVTALSVPLVMPAAASPEPRPAATSPQEAPAPGMGHWLKWGASTMLGALVAEILLPTHAIYMAGGSAGNALRNAWEADR